MSSATVYIGGKPRLVVRVGDMPRYSGERDRAKVVHSWLPLWRLSVLVEKAYVAVKRANTLPDGEPFVVDGVDYSSPREFAEQLGDEIRERILLLLAERTSGGMGADAPMAAGNLAASPLSRVQLQPPGEAPPARPVKQKKASASATNTPEAMTNIQVGNVDGTHCRP